MQGPTSRLVLSVVFVLAASAAFARFSHAQGLTDGIDGPRFLLASSAAPSQTISRDVNRILKKRIGATALQTSAIVGRVSDANAHSALAGATVVVVGATHSATTGSDGRYRIADVTPGTYTVRARYIGYAPGTASVTLSGDQEATADFALEKSAQPLNEVVTTGTVLPTEVRALPTPISVINEEEIAIQRPHTVQEVLRQAVPTMVSWDLPAAPGQTVFSVRGASTVGGGGRRANEGLRGRHS